MPKALIAFFSQGGTTANTAEFIAKGLRTAGFQVDFGPIKTGRPPDLSAYELLGVGAPVYACRIPFNVNDYVRSLPRLDGVPAFAFNLYGTYPADAGGQLLKLLSKKGARNVGYFACRGAEYNLGYLLKGYLFSPDNPTSEEMSQAEAFGRTVAARVLAGDQAPVVTFRPPPLVYRLERASCDRFLIEQLLTRTFRVTADCNSCGLCVKLCPNANIRKGDNGRPKWGRHCLGCATCQMKCPKDAITSMLSMLGSMFDYNVRHMSSDLPLEFARVHHKNGRTERLEEPGGRP